MATLQSRTGPVQGQNRVFPVKFFSQGKTCFHYRGTLFSLQGPCFHYRDFPVRKTSQGKPCFHYREWVCSVDYRATPPLKFFGPSAIPASEGRGLSGSHHQPCFCQSCWCGSVKTNFVQSSCRSGQCNYSLYILIVYLNLNGHSSMYCAISK